jgi:hypothetical protein
MGARGMWSWVDFTIKHVQALGVGRKLGEIRRSNFPLLL